jgi:hypothetical protein
LRVGRPGQPPLLFKSKHPDEALDGLPFPTSRRGSAHHTGSREADLCGARVTGQIHRKGAPAGIMSRLHIERRSKHLRFVLCAPPQIQGSPCIRRASHPGNPRSSNSVHPSPLGCHESQPHSCHTRACLRFSPYPPPEFPLLNPRLFLQSGPSNPRNALVCATRCPTTNPLPGPTRANRPQSSQYHARARNE